MMRSRLAGNWFAGVLALALCLPLQAEPTTEDIAAAKQLNEQVLKLYEQGRAKEALPIALRAVPQIEKTLGSTHLETVRALSRLGLLHDSMGEYDKAELVFKRALATLEKVWGPEDPLTAATIYNLASVSFSQGDYPKSKSLHERALAIREKVQGPEHQDTANSLYGLSMVVQELGALAESESLLQRALAIYEKTLGTESSPVVSVFERLARVKTLLGAYAEAESLYRRVIAAREKALGPNHPQTADGLRNLATLYSQMGAHRQAELWYRRALPIYEATRGPDHPATAGCLNGLGNALSESGAYAQAERLLQRALAINEKTLGPEHARTSVVMINLARLYRMTGAYSNAEPLYERAISIREKVSGPEHPDAASYIQMLGGLYLEMGAYTKAEVAFTRSLAISERVLGRKHLTTAFALDNLGSLYSKTRAHTRAEPFYRRALAIRTQALGPNHSLTAETLRGLAGMYYASGDFARARPLYLRALAIQEKVLDPAHPALGETLNDLAALDWAAGKTANALPLLLRAQRIENQNSTRFLLSGSEARKQDYLRGLAKNTSRNVSFSMSLNNPQAVAHGFGSVLQFKGRVLDAMSDSVVRLRQSVAPEDRALFEQLAQVVNEVSTLVYAEPSKKPLERQRERLKQLSNRQETLEAELANRSSSFRSQTTPITVREVSSAVPADAILVEWFRYQPFDPKQGPDATAAGNARYVAYILERDRDAVVIDLGEASVLDRLVAEFRSAASNPQRSDVKERATALSEKLIKPLRPHLDDRRHLLISPDGALNLLPVTALVDANGEYLAKSFDITYLTSGRDLVRFGTEVKPRSEAVVIADPNYGEPSTLLAESSTPDGSQRSAEMDRAGLTFRQLPATGLEAQDIKKLLNLEDTNIFTRAEATESRLKLLQGPRILHVATHGFFLDDLQRITNAAPNPQRALRENPLLRSGLAFAGANVRRSGTNDDGILTALEAAQLDLSGTELVVLSACETGVGEVLNSEGVYGLRRALVLAGAQTQVSSLWKVADQPTRVLMTDYYAKLLKGGGRSSALRDAQKALLAVPEYSHPYYWAGFIAIGQWQPLHAR